MLALMVDLGRLYDVMHYHFSVLMHTRLVETYHSLFVFWMDIHYMLITSILPCQHLSAYLLFVAQVSKCSFIICCVFPLQTWCLMPCHLKHSSWFFLFSSACFRFYFILFMFSLKDAYPLLMSLPTTVCLFTHGGHSSEVKWRQCPLLENWRSKPQISPPPTSPSWVNIYS